MRKLAGLVLLLLCLIISQKTTAQQEVQPYQIGEIPFEMSYVTKIYKQVYQGCELFIAVSRGGNFAQTVAIATGRGCK